MTRDAAVTRRYRWAVASRVAAATLGGYALTSAATVVLALAWPLPKPQALLSATMLSFALYTVVVIWVFTTRSAVRAWAVMLAGTAVLSLIGWALVWMAGRGGMA